MGVAAAASGLTYQRVEGTAAETAAELEVGMGNLEACRPVAAEETAAEVQQSS